MPKYIVDVSQTLNRYAEVEVEAEDEEEAGDIAWEVATAKGYDGWYEKLRDSDTHAALVEEAA